MEPTGRRGAPPDDRLRAIRGRLPQLFPRISLRSIRATKSTATLCALAANRIETGPPADPETPFMTDAPHISPLDQARILSEALPHMQQYDEETIVIKYGGHAMGAEDLAKAFARDIVLLEQTAINPGVVHGGGPQIATMLQGVGIKSAFFPRQRLAGAPTTEIAEIGPARP